MSLVQQQTLDTSRRCSLLGLCRHLTRPEDAHFLAFADSGKRAATRANRSSEDSFGGGGGALLPAGGGGGALLPAGGGGGGPPGCGAGEGSPGGGGG